MDNYFVDLAVKQYKVYGDKGIDDIYFSMSEQNRKNFDKELINIKHPLAYEPGTNKYRFEMYVKKFNIEII